MTTFLLISLTNFSKEESIYSLEILKQIYLRTPVGYFYCFFFNHMFLHTFLQISFTYPAGIYMFKVNNRNTRTRCEMCSKLTIKTIGVVLVS